MEDRTIEVSVRRLSNEPSPKVVRHKIIGSLISSLFFVFACNVSKMNLYWDDTSKNETGFRIYRIVGNKKTIIAEVGPNVTQYVDTGAPPKACYLVTAFNANGESAATNPLAGPNEKGKVIAGGGVTEYF